VPSGRVLFFLGVFARRSPEVATGGPLGWATDEAISYQPTAGGVGTWVN